jgi:general secretion pathway protein G
VELLVALAILAVLVSVSLPFAEVTARRDKEMELRADLRDMRLALDRFHQDWLDGKINRMASGVSGDGYPADFQVLVGGVDGPGLGSAPLKYLRRVPENPFGDKGLPPDHQWGLKGYRDKPTATEWGGKDLWDVYCPGDEKALDGSFYHDW